MVHGYIVDVIKLCAQNCAVVISNITMVFTFDDTHCTSHMSETEYTAVSTKTPRSQLAHSGGSPMAQRRPAALCYWVVTVTSELELNDVL